MGLAAAFKLTPGIFVAWWLWKRQWRAAAWAAATVAACWFVVQPIVFGPALFGEAFRGWIGSVAPFLGEGVVAENVSGGFRFTNQSLEAAAGRFLAEVPTGLAGIGSSVNVAALDLGAVRVVVAALQAGLLALLAWLCRGAVRDRNRIGPAFEIALVSIATLWLSPISWINHYVALLPAFAVATYRVRTRPAAGPGRRVLKGAAIAAAALVATGIGRLPQALSLPFLGGVVLFAASAVALRKERAARPPGTPQ